MTWWRRVRTPGRLPPSGPDPVGAALHELAGPLLPQHDEDPPVLADLPSWVHVDEADDAPRGFDTLVTFDDELMSYADPYDSGLDLALADQPGVDDVLAEDREVVYLRSRLALADVHAAVVRAVVEVNRSPRTRPVDAAVVTDEQAEALADAVAPLLAAAGLTRHAEGGRRGLYWSRAGEDGFLQSLALVPGSGVLGDGTRLDHRLDVLHGVLVPERVRPPGRLPAPGTLVPGSCTTLQHLHVEATAPAVQRALEEQVLPWLDGTRGRASFARWVAEDPQRVFPPADRPAYALLLARWGHPAAARALLEDLRRHWRSLRDLPDAVEARRLLDGG